MQAPRKFPIPDLHRSRPGFKARARGSHQGYRTWLGALLAALTLAPALPAHAASTDIIISQVYGGGNSGSSTYKNDFIEIYNSGSTAVNIQ